MGGIQLHPYVGGALGGAVGGTLPSKAPPTQGEGGLGGGVGERLSCRLAHSGLNLSFQEQVESLHLARTVMTFF